MKKRPKGSSHRNKKALSLLLILPLMDIIPKLPGPHGDDQEGDIERAQIQIHKPQSTTAIKPVPHGRGNKGQRKGILGWLTNRTKKPKKP